MSLRRLGIPISDQVNEQQESAERQSLIIRAMNRLNDYMALMTNETSPPKEHDDTDETT